MADQLISNVVRERLVHTRIFDRNHIVLLEELHDCCQEDSQEQQQESDFQESESHMPLEEVWINHPVNVHILHHQQQRADRDEVFFVSFRSLWQKSQEWNDEFEEQQCERNRHPSPFSAHQIVFSFFWNVCVPDQHELREGDIRPEHSEAFHELRYVMEVIFRVVATDETFFLHVDHHQDQECQ